MAVIKSKNRYVILSGLFIIAFCCGGMYAWSVFSGSLAEYRGWDYSKVTLAYSLMSLMLSLFGIMGGRLLDRFGPKKMMLAASVLWGGGWFLTGCVIQIWQLYIVFGFMTALGSGLAYNPSLTTVVRWFPDKKGLVSGLITGGCGVASLIVAPFANMLLEYFNVSAAFKIVGVVFFVLMFVSALLVTAPDPDWKPAGIQVPSGENVFVKAVDWRGMLKDKRFYIMWLAFLGGCVSGLMLIGHASRIGQEVAGIDASQAALLVGIMAVANFVGRILMGVLSDKLGRYQTLMLALVFSALDMIVLSQSSDFVLFVSALVLLCFCYGGVLAIFPNIVGDTFGLATMGVNYAIIFTAYGVAALVGPMTASAIYAGTGSYTMAFIIAGVFAVMAFILVSILYFSSQKARSKNQKKKA